MSEDEVFATIVSCFLAGVFWFRWYRHCQAITWLRCGLVLRLAMIAVPVVCGALLCVVLGRWASHDVRGDPRYLFMYSVMGAAWVGLGVRLLGLFGLSMRDDALERRNPAAAWALVGGLVGLTLCFAGGNIGDGPGWWVVVYSAWLSTGSLLAVWLVLDRLTTVSESVTVERDVASGMRLAGLLAAAGLILGRAVAGDWVSVSATNGEFLGTAWPVLVLLALAVPCEWLCRPTAEQPEPSWLVCGLPPLVIYVGSAAAWLAQVGLEP